MKYRIRMIVLVVNILSMIVGMMIFSVDYDPEKHMSNEERIAQAMSLPLEKDKYPEVNELMTKFVNAKFNADMTTLAECVNDISRYDEESLKRQSIVIESIQNVYCYTIKGYYEDSYIVYVWTEEKVKNMDVVVPNVVFNYVCESNGKLCVYAGGATADIGQYIANAKQNPEVVALLEKANATCEQLKTDYPEYKSLVDSINNMTSTPEPTETPPESTNADASVG